MKARAVLYLIILFPMLTGCTEPMNTTASDKTVINQELGLLPKLISLPKQPIAVRWQEPDPDDRERANLIALLTFTPQDYQEIIESSPKFDVIRDERLPEDMFNKWVGESVSDQLTTEKDNGVVILKGVHALKPDLFTKTDTSPFVNGSITPLGEGNLLVVLSSM